MVANPEISRHLRLALAHQKAGRTAPAEQLYRHILARDPDNVDALNLLGVIRAQAGAIEEAHGLLNRAIARRDDIAELHFNLGKVQVALRRQRAAEESFRRAHDLRPKDARVLSALARVMMARGRTAEALPILRAFTAASPKNIGAHLRLTQALTELGRTDEAERVARAIVKAAPQDARGHAALGDVLYKRAAPSSTSQMYRATLKGDAADAAGRALLTVDAADGVEKTVDRVRDAIAGARIELTPRTGANDNVKPDYAPAIAAYEAAVALDPGFAEAFNKLGFALRLQGRPDDAAAACRRAFELNPDSDRLHSTVLLDALYRPDVTLADQRRDHRDWFRRHGAALAPRSPVPIDRPDPDRRLRLGFVSSDFGRHPVGQLIASVLAYIDPDQAEIYCYSNRRQMDRLTQRIKTAAHHWREVQALSDEACAARVADDKIDFLFDLNGHTAHNRLLVFARKPAPIQIAWIGYPATSGLDTMDYLIADRHMVPPEHEHGFTESIVRLPECGWCYRPSDNAPPVGTPPSTKNGYPTFGSFNNLAKIGPHVLACWARILNRLPDARLVLKYHGLHDDRNRERYRQWFADSGGDADRLDLQGAAAPRDYLAAYGEIDITLDPFPFGGGVTSCDSLWMGVPVITLAGDRLAGRMATSFNYAAGRADCVATDLSTYADIAVRMATDRTWLADTRHGLRDRMAGSPLANGKQFADQLTAAVREIWRRRCAEV